ncbi:MAG: N-acetylmuramic acid 6-phosphate etherase [Roseiarcus sp.]|uniref:N-acetylmuramic acid 6-phosphate etherase n=1 Tax=Roseiarcus sp. TaxID=1969460 RepID=UPI003C688D44
MAELERLISEERNPNTMDIDLLPTAEVLRVMNREDRSVADAVGKVIPEIARAVDSIVDAFAKGGRLIYLGAGTSGRLGVLDAAECPATFSVPADMVLGLMAGGADAFSKASEGAEDNAEAGVEALKDIGLIRRDVVVGITVSGRTPYVVGGLTYAKALGATTVALSCNQDAAIARMADISILPVVGPEVLAGSTRLKSGTAQKLVLNMLTTASMIRSGKCYQNLMVDLKPTNMKLVGRAARIVTQATGCTAEQAQKVLRLTGNDVKLAILITVTGMPLKRARLALENAGGLLRKAIA